MVPDIVYPTFFEQKSTRHPRAFKIPTTQKLSKNSQCSPKKEGENKRGMHQGKLNKEQSPFPIQVPLNRRELATWKKWKKEYI